MTRDVGPVGAMTCPTTTLCIGTTASGIITSTDPTGGASAWTFTPLGGSSRPSCPSVNFCAMVADDDVLTSSDPTGGAGAWTVTRNVAPGPYPLTAVSCASASLCVATSDDGKVFSSTNPTGGAGGWTAASFQPGHLQSISCPTTTFCAATGSGHVVTSTNPTGGASAWDVATVAGGFGQITCPTASLCVIASGDLVTSTNPTGGSVAWIDSQRSPPANAQAVSCASNAFCAVIDPQHTLLTSAAPANGFDGYAATTLDVPPCTTAGNCVTQDLYVRDDGGTRIVDTAVSAAGGAINNVTLSGDSTTVTWNHDGQPHSLTLH